MSLGFLPQLAGGLQAKVEQPDLPTAQDNPVRMLIDDLDAEARQVRHDLGQRHRRVLVEDLEAQVGGISRVIRTVHDQAQVILSQPVEQFEVQNALLGREFLLVLGSEVNSASVTLNAAGQGDELVIPVRSGVGELCLQFRVINWRKNLTVRDLGSQGDPDQGGLTHHDGRVELDRAGPLGDDSLDDANSAGVETVGRDEDQQVEEPTPRTAADQCPKALLLAQVDDRHDEWHELFGRGLEKGITWELSDGTNDRLAAMGVGSVSRKCQHAGGLGAEDRDVRHRLGVCGRPQQTDEAVLSDDGAVLVTDSHANVIPVSIALHGGTNRVLRDDDGGMILAVRDRIEALPVIGDAQPGTGYWRHGVPVDPELLVGQVHEMVIGQPFQELTRRVTIIGAPLGGTHQLSGPQHRLLHRRPVVRGPNNLVKAAVKILIELLGSLASVNTNRRRGINVNPGLRLAALASGSSDTLNSSLDVALDTENRVPNVLNSPPMTKQARHDGVDEEGTVIHDDLHRVDLTVRPRRIDTHADANRSRLHGKLHLPFHRLTNHLFTAVVSSGVLLQHRCHESRDDFLHL